LAKMMFLALLAARIDATYAMAMILMTIAREA
jgi:hypothetical protein